MNSIDLHFKTAVSVSPLLGRIDRIFNSLVEEFSEIAVDRYISFIAVLDKTCGFEVIEKSYFAFYAIIERLDSLHKVETSIVQLLQISSEDCYAKLQVDLAIKLARWYFKAGIKAEEKQRKIACLTNAIHYISKTFCFSYEISSEIECFASRIFKVCAVQLSIFEKQFRDAVSFNNKEQVLQLERNLHTRFNNRFCCQEERDAFIQLFYQQISNCFAQTVALRVGRVESSGLAEIHSTMDDWLEKKIEPECFITATYRQRLNNLRKDLADLFYQNIGPCCVLVDKVRVFQEDVSTRFTLFFQSFLEDTFAIIGEPPCEFDCRPLGSLPKKEFCFGSDIEWCILIEDLSYASYFLQLAHIFELQIISLGEDPASELPVFTCLGVKCLGLRVDDSGNPARGLPSLIQCPEQMAQLQKNPEHHILANSLRKTISLKQSSPKLFEEYKFHDEKILEETVPESTITFRMHQTFELLRCRLKDFNRVWEDPFQGPTIHLKKQYVQLLNYMLNDLSLYFNIQVNNTIDLIEELGKKEVFSEESVTLLQEAVASLYSIRLDLHIQYKKEEIEMDKLSKESGKQLQKIYLLILKPFYEKLEKCENEPRLFQKYFKKINLLKWALYDKPITTETVPQLQSLIQSLAEHLAFTVISKSQESHALHLGYHLPYYEYLSKDLSGDSLRKVYIDTLMHFEKYPEIASLISSLAKIPNSGGVRQSQRLKQEQLHKAIMAMTTTKPEGKNPVAVCFRESSEVRYLRKEILPQIMQKNGDLKRRYKSAHNVAFAKYGEHEVHVKQTPSHALMEYAIFALAGRLDAHLSPPVELVSFKTQDKTYPVLISESIDGKPLGENEQLEPSSFTWGCLLDVLTHPGDGRCSNYLKENGTNRLVIIDHEISFIEPLTRELMGYKINFMSVLFCLDQQFLDFEVLKKFIKMNPETVLKSWLDELILINKDYQNMNLFSKEEEKKFYEENKEKRFRDSLLLRRGVVASLLVQFYHLQDCLFEVLKKRTALLPIELLPFLITLRGTHETGKQTVNLVHRSYERASRKSSPHKRLKEAMRRNIEDSLTPMQAECLYFEKLPSMDDICAREQYAPEKAREELFLCSLQNRMLGVNIGKSDNQFYVKANFKKIRENNKAPDEDSQLIILNALTCLIGKTIPNLFSLTFAYCTVLTLDTLRPFLHKDLKYLNLSGCSLIKQDVIEEIENLCPNLEELYLNGCPALKFFSKNNHFFSKTYLYFPKLKKLQIKNCNSLESIEIEAPLLENLYADNNPRLDVLLLKPLKLYLKGVFTKCWMLDLEKIKRDELLKWLPRAKILEHMVEPLIGLHDHDPILNLQNGFIGDSGAKVLARALSVRSCLIEFNLNNNNIHNESEAICRSLRSHVGLRKINLSGNRISSKVMDILIKILPELVQLTSINFAGIPIDQKQIFRMCKALNPRFLTDINLEDCEINNTFTPLIQLVEKGTSLESINLNGNKISDDNAMTLVQELIPHKRLKTVKLSRMGLEFNTLIETLKNLFVSLPEIHTIELMHNAFHERGIKYLMKNLSNVSSLKTLNIDKYKIIEKFIPEFGETFIDKPVLNSLKNSGTIVRVSQVLAALPSLQNLDLSGCKIGKGFLDMSILSQNIASHSLLRSIDLKENYLTPPAIKSLCEALAGHRDLNAINLAENSIKNEAKSVIQLLKSLNALTTLNLAKTDLKVEDMDSLCNLLKGFSTLTSLNLSYNEIGSQAAAALSEAIRNSHHMTSINLAFCGIGNSIWNEEGGDELLEIVNSLTHLTELSSINLAGNAIEEINFKKLCKLLASATKLTSIELDFLQINRMVKSNGRIDFKGIKAICDSLRNNTSLEVVHLSGHPVGTEGIKYLCRLLSKQSSLTSLHLDCMQLEDEDIKMIAEVLESKTSLTDISLQFNHAITEEGIAVLRKALVRHPKIPSWVLESMAHNYFTMPFKIFDYIVSKSQLPHQVFTGITYDSTIPSELKNSMYNQYDFGTWHFLCNREKYKEFFKE